MKVSCENFIYDNSIYDNFIYEILKYEKIPIPYIISYMKFSYMKLNVKFPDVLIKNNYKLTPFSNCTVITVSLHQN